jgi:long-chain fatty acid transport protein
VKRHGLGTLAAALTALSAGPAAASGFLTARFGGEHGHPTTDNPSAMYFNPAGLALGHGTRLYLDGTFAYIAAGYDRPADAVYPVIPTGEPGTGTPAEDLDRNSGENSLMNFAAAPMAAVVTDFGESGVGFGLGVYFPFGGASTWDRMDKYEDDAQYPGAYDGPQRWWSIDGTLRSMYVTAAFGGRVQGTGLSLGVAVNYISSEVHTLRARNSPADDATVSRLANGKTRLAEGRSRVDVKGKDVSASAGLLWEALEKELWLGLSYQAQPGFGTMQLDGDLETVLGSSKDGAATTKVRLEQDLPDVIRLGGRWRPTPTTEVRLNGEYARWSVFQRQCLINMDAADGKTTDCDLNDAGNLNEGATSDIVQNIERDWEDTIAVRAGGSYWLDETLELFGALGYDGNAVPDERIDPALPDFHDISVSAGARVELLEKSLALAGTYTQFFYVPRDVAPRTKVQGVPQSDFPPESPSVGPDAAGKYTRSIGALNINVQYTF